YWALSSLQKSTPLISGRLTSSKSTRAFQNARESLHSAAEWATPTTRAMPDSSMRPFRPSVRILWSSTMATSIIFSIIGQFKFHMGLGPLIGGIDVHFALKGGHTLADVPQAHALFHGFRIESDPVVLDRKGNATVLLDQLDIDLGGLGMFQGVVDQFMDAAVDHDLQF